MAILERIDSAATDHPDRWMDILHEVGVYDFYHLPAYQRLSEEQVGGTAILPIFRYDGYSMAFPLLIRNIVIPGVKSGDYRDAACVPGLTGPVASHDPMPERVRHNLIWQFQEFLKRNRLVSAYSRLHFLFGQEAFLSGCGETIEEGIEITLDFTVSPEEHFAGYRRTHRKNLERLWSMGFVCEEVGTEYLDEFLRVYSATMNRVGAPQIYCSGKSYFKRLMCDMAECSHLFVCRDGKAIACAGIALKCNDHIHAYRTGISDEYLGLAVSKLLYHELWMWGHSIGARAFHFGGGVDGKRDSLWYFKMGFGGQEHAWNSWRYIVNQEVYADLCRQAFAHAGRTPNDDYFPEYRSPSLGLG